MVTRRVNPYAKVYAFGADGNVARAGSPIASPHKTREASRRVHRQLSIRVPLWILILVVAGILFIQAFTLLSMRSDTTREQKRINVLKSELAQNLEKIEMLEVSLDQAADPSRIRAIAENRLGMRLPRPEQINVMPRPQLPQRAMEMAVPEEGGGVIRMLLSLVGL